MCGHKTHRECGEGIETKASKQVERLPNIKELEKKFPFMQKEGGHLQLLLSLTTER